jgi:UPF0755 protein
MKTAWRVTAGAAGAVLAAAAILAFLNSSPRRGPSAERFFSVSRGESVSRIADRLQQEGYIRAAPLLRAMARLGGTQSAFRAGYYRIPPRARTTGVYRLLVSGEQSLEKFTIPEGWTIGKIARLLESRGIAPAAEFEAAARSPELAARLGIRGKSLEGYLYPDTYFVPRPFPGSMFAELMVKNFFDTLSRVAPDYRTMDPGALHDTVILASIVEREYRAAEEAPLIASVFLNRMKRNIGLESCATLEYIITEIQQKAHPEYITLEDERIDSPYNTYKWAGLPPGPISNPGRVALEAAFRPARTSYLYFVLRDKDAGRHYFSRDLREHNEAKVLYLKKQGA